MYNMPYFYYKTESTVHYSYRIWLQYLMTCTENGTELAYFGHYAYIAMLLTLETLNPFAIHAQRLDIISTSYDFLIFIA